MWDKAVDWIFEKYPIIFLMLLVASAAITATALVIKYRNKIKKAEADCHDLKNTLIPNLSNRIDTDVLPKLTSIASNLKSLVIFLGGKHDDMNENLFISRSPVQLTDLGTTILQVIGGKEYIDNNIGQLIPLLEKEGLKSALDVENYSRVVLTSQFNTDAFTPIKNYLYKNPLFVQGQFHIKLDLPTVTNIMGIYLRNKYFERHPELNIE